MNRLQDMLAAYGRAVESLGGRYVTAEDVGTSARGVSSWTM